MEDDFDVEFEPTYSDMVANLKEVRDEVETLDQDSLIDELSGVQHNLEGKESEKVQRLIFKNHADVDLTEEEMEFLRNIYVLYYSPFGLFVDDAEEDEDEF